MIAISDAETNVSYVPRTEGGYFKPELVRALDEVGRSCPGPFGSRFIVLLLPVTIETLLCRHFFRLARP